MVLTTEYKKVFESYPFTCKVKEPYPMKIKVKAISKDMFI